MRALVLGGDGFIGSHMVDKLLALGHEVTVFDRLPAGGPRNLPPEGGRLRILRGEFGDIPRLRAAVQGQEIAYHFISATTAGSSWENPEFELDDNLRPTLKFLRLAVDAGVRKIAFASSGGAVYGRNSGLLREETPAAPCSPYGIGKLAIEGFLCYLKERAGVECDIYRIANAYGPRQSATGTQGVIGVWMDKILKGSPIEVFGDESIVRDYVFATDVAELMSFSAATIAESRLFNIGTGRGISILALLEIVRKAVPVAFDAAILPARSFDAPSVRLDSSRILACFPGFRFHSLEEGIRKTWQWRVSRSVALD